MYGGVRNIEERQYTVALHQGQNACETRKLRANVVQDIRLSTTRSISIEKVRRKYNRIPDGKYVRGENFGYRIVGQDFNSNSHLLTLDELREYVHKLNEYLKSETE